jgi:uncharacterized membrane protein YqiK
LDSSDYEQMRSLLTDRDAFAPVVLKEVMGAHDSDQVAIVTVQDGPGLPKDELLAPDVGDSHNSFQEPEKFLAAGGLRGRQERVLVEGTYYINRLFATVEFIKKTVIPVGQVGVVVSYTGRKGVDMSGAEYSHGELVATGCRGVWREPLMPGKYAFNTYAGKIELVPTTNFVLMWESGESGSSFDANLKEITLITKDAFEPQLPLSVVVHIDYRKAPLVVQRFGNVGQLVKQTLDPMVSSYFKNVSQTKTFIELIQSRSELQTNASQDMKERFLAYSLEFQEVLIGTPRPQKGDTKIENIMAQLRDRQIAREQVETFAQKQIAADKERELNEAEQRAAKQKELTGSLVDISIKENQGAAAVKAAEKRRQEIQELAQGDKFRQEQEGAGRAAAIRSVGEAEASAIKAKSEALQGEGADKQLMQTVMLRLAEAFETARVPLVPQIQLGGGGADGNAFSTLMGLMSALKTRELLVPPAKGSVSWAGGGTGAHLGMPSLRRQDEGASLCGLFQHRGDCHDARSYCASHRIAGRVAGLERLRLFAHGAQQRRRHDRQAVGRQRGAGQHQRWQRHGQRQVRQGNQCAELERHLRRPQRPGQGRPLSWPGSGRGERRGGGAADRQPGQPHQRHGHADAGAGGGLAGRQVVPERAHSRQSGRRNPRAGTGAALSGFTRPPGYAFVRRRPASTSSTSPVVLVALAPRYQAVCAMSSGWMTSSRAARPT